MGPLFTSLTNVQDVPWAAGRDVFGNAAWNAAATLASGTFPINVSPGFHAGITGSVFTTVGTSTTLGQSPMATLTTIVRTRTFPATALPDYNDNGIVDAADYVLWRKGSLAGRRQRRFRREHLGLQLVVRNFGEIVGPAPARAVPAADPRTRQLRTSVLAAILLGFARRPLVALPVLRWRIADSPKYRNPKSGTVFRQSVVLTTDYTDFSDNHSIRAHPCDPWLKQAIRY